MKIRTSGLFYTKIYTSESLYYLKKPENKQTDIQLKKFRE